MLAHNKRLMDFLKANGIKATVKYLDKGSLRGCWRLYNRTVKWSLELADKLNGLGFKGFDGSPLGEFSGNAGLLCLCVRGHNEFLTEPAAISDAYAETHAVSGENRERNDCAVRAVAIASGQDYAEVLDLFSKLGRKRRCRTKDLVTRKAVLALGFYLIPVKDRFAVGTVSQLEAKLPKLGTYLVRIAGHILCAKNGKVHDWTAGRNHRIREIYEVVPFPSTTVAASLDTIGA